MKTVFVLSTLFPAGLLAAFLGTSVARQDEPQETTPEPTRRVRVVQSAEPGGDVTIQELEVEALAPAMPSEPMVLTVPGIPGGVQAAGPGTMTFQTEGRRIGRGIAGHPTTAFAFSVGHGANSEKTQKAIAKLRDAEGDDEKSEAKEELKAALEDEFDAYLKRQSEELDRMEEKLAKLRKQLDKRSDAKDDLVSLQLQMLVNEANGLGWPTGSGATWVGPGGNAFGVTSGTLFDRAGQGPMLTVPAPAMIATPAAIPYTESTDATEYEEVEDDQPAPRAKRRGPTR